MSEDLKGGDSGSSDNLDSVKEVYTLPEEFKHLEKYSSLFDYLLDKLPNFIRFVRELYHVRKNVKNRKGVDAATNAASSL